MKKVFAIVFVAVVGICVWGPKVADAQVYGAYCCDVSGVRRCVINPTPVGNPCFCYGQGGGITCL